MRGGRRGGEAEDMACVHGEVFSKYEYQTTSTKRWKERLVIDTAEGERASERASCISLYDDAHCIHLHVWRILQGGVCVLETQPPCKIHPVYV